jgi:hypothetical protein
MGPKVWPAAIQDDQLTGLVSVKVHFYHAPVQQVLQQWYVHDQEQVFHFYPVEE